MKKEKEMTVAQKAKSLSSDVKKKDFTFFKDFQEEMKKVSWTTKEELKVCTKIVIGSIFFLGLGIYISDLMIRGVLQGVDRIFRVMSS